MCDVGECVNLLYECGLVSGCDLFGVIVFWFWIGYLLFVVLNVSRGYGY